MEFFDKKQDVINLQVTQFGRHLMSKGQFKPAYYSFFDDNVLYESEKAGIEEEQNKSQERIKESQTMRPQIGFSSLDRQFRNNYEAILSEEDDPASFQRTPEKNYLLPMPLGTSGTDTNNPPSWQIDLLKGAITGSAENFIVRGPDGGNYAIPIPQVHVEKNILVDRADVLDDGAIEEVEDDFAVLGGTIISDEDDIFILLKILEKNGTFQKKNFDIEMFEIIESEENGVGVQNLRASFFFTKIKFFRRSRVVKRRYTSIR
jgi:hypothetical protein